MENQMIQKFLAAATTDRTIAGKLAALAAECGYEFTAEDLLATEVAEIPEDELTEVTGGAPKLWLNMRQPFQS